MDARSVRKLYPAMSGAERFRLALAADARGDANELSHLVATCPTVVARVQDFQFRGHVDATLGLVHALLIGTGPMIGWLELLQAIDGAIGAALAALVQATEDLLATLVEPEEPPAKGPPGSAFRSGADPEGGMALQILTAARDQAAREIATSLQGFDRACREVAGLDPEAVIAAFAPFLTEHLEPFGALLEQAEPDPDAVGDRLEGFATVWEAWMKSGPPSQERDEG